MWGWSAVSPEVTRASSLTYNTSVTAEIYIAVLHTLSALDIYISPADFPLFSHANISYFAIASFMSNAGVLLSRLKRSRISKRVLNCKTLEFFYNWKKVLANGSCGFNDGRISWNVLCQLGGKIHVYFEFGFITVAWHVHLFCNL